MESPEEAKQPEVGKSETISEDIKLKKGNYRVHVFIEQARSLVPAEGSDVSDPVFIVTAFDTSKSTKAFSNVSSESIIPIGEHIFIDGFNKLPEQISNERISIQVRDHNSLLKDKMLGIHEMDMTYLYSLPDHSLLHQWVIISNPDSENFSDLKGYLKVGVSVLHEDDKAIDLCKAESADKNDSTMLPVHVKPKTMQMIIQVLKAENLPVMDRGGTLDAYCIVKFAGAECRTSVITADKANMSAMWCEQIYIPCLVPCVSNSVKISLLDHDTIGKDELVGSVFLNFDQMKNGKYQQYFWCNFYGAPPLASGDQAELMNSVPSKASHWRGRVLLKAWIKEKVKNIYKKTQKIKEENIEAKIIEEFETGDTFEIRAQVLSASALPEKSGKYKIKIEWSGVETLSSEKNTENGCIDWFEVCKRKVTQIPKNSEGLLPDAIVYLILDDEKICYLRVPALECMNRNSIATWKQFSRDKHVGAVKEDWKAGFIRVRIYIGPYDEGAPADAEWNNLKKPEMQKFKLYAHVFQCRDLAAADKNGLADPYINIYCAGSEISTKNKPCELTLNPRWYQTFPLNVAVTRIEEAAPVIISLFDYDDIDSDDFLGLCLIELKTAAIDADNAPKPKWIKLNTGENGTEKGEILVSFSLSSKVNENRVFDIVPKFTDKSIDINILGLRDLKPAVGWLPVNKAFLRFDLNSLELPGSSQTVKPLETQPFEKGSDPNILTTVSARVKMPNDPLYAPFLTVTVHDYLFSGASQPLIGTFSINLGKYFFPKQKFLTGMKASSKLLIAIDSVNTEAKEITKEETKAETEEEKNKKEAEKKTEEKKKKDAEKLKKKAEKLKKEKEEHRKEEENKKNEEIKNIDEELRNVCENGNLMVIWPTFETVGKKEKEVNQPGDNYIAVGYTRTPNDKQKHYRYLLNDIFESTYIFSNLPFEEFEITKGQLVGGDDSIFSIFSRNTITVEEPPTLQNVGKFKALIKLNEYPQLQKDEEFEKISKQLLNKKKCVVRVYILDAFDIEQKDSNSLSDPYVRLKLADTVISDRDNHQEDVTNPQIFRSFDLHTALPGKSILKIQMWDYNSFAPDSKIGTTRIDLEDRFFNEQWMALKEKPAETRPLHIRTCKRAQGYIRLWVEIFEEGKNIPEICNIAAKPPANFEARLIIWKTEDVPCNDIEGLSDLYVVAKLNSLPEKLTDTHFRAASGKGSWNWRLKFSLTLPNPLSNILTLQIWDKDILSGNDIISEHSLEFDDMAKEAWEEGTTVKMLKAPEGFAGLVNHKKSDVFWVDCKMPGGDDGGKVSISFELIPQEIADNNKVGEARDEPNHSPVLGPPTGRFKLSLNPLDMLGQLVGPELKRKVCCGICIVLCLLLIIFALPIFLTNGISKAAYG